jgi:hypothetical protein
MFNPRNVNIRRKCIARNNRKERKTPTLAMHRKLQACGKRSFSCIHITKKGEKRGKRTIEVI